MHVSAFASFVTPGLLVTYCLRTPGLCQPCGRIQLAVPKMLRCGSCLQRVSSFLRSRNTYNTLRLKIRVIYCYAINYHQTEWFQTIIPHYPLMFQGLTGIRWWLQSEGGWIEVIWEFPGLDIEDDVLTRMSGSTAGCWPNTSLHVAPPQGWFGFLTAWLSQLVNGFSQKR